jgi:hypothetical protein
VLGKDFRGIIICDGWRSSASFSKRLQRCWAHLLREAKFIGEEFSEAIPLYDSLRMLYRDLTDALGKGPPLAEREKLWEMAYQKLCDLMKDRYEKKEVNNFFGKIKNGLKHFLTFVITPGVEPTNNRAERALREHVVIRKIIGTLRNEKGTQIHERITSCLATWKQQGLNPYQQIISRVS